MSSLHITDFAQRFLDTAKNVKIANLKVLAHPAEIDRKEFFDLFVTSKIRKKDVFINLNTIVGSREPYNGRTWYKMLNTLERGRTNVNLLEDNDSEYCLDFYIHPKKFKDHRDEKPCIHFYNGSGYIVTGQHRFCIAKFLQACGYIPQQEIGPSEAKYINYDAESLKLFINTYDSFRAIRRKTFGSSYRGAKLQIEDITLNYGKIKGNPTYVIHYNSRLHLETRQIKLSNVNEFIYKYNELLYYPEKKYISAAKQMYKRIKSMVA
ncbi:MAG: hypothetical protein COB67_00160 [SAR324 cluster bacterium]|uniref:Uncharacterized protein n=1 Tax=SAR324 cluster bacterium TaxID=2024889 RepID=A0A2A4TBJ2_9DELT|nr:MAG: hypothetical protein COB67_00160 [SAR324 cluster bacterium]